MKNNSLERDVKHSDGYFDDLQHLIRDLVSEIEDIEFDNDRKDDKIAELEKRIEELENI